jgi:hypothetical protein
MNVRVVAAVGVLAVLAAAPVSRVTAQVEQVLPAKDPADALMKRMLDALKADSYDLWVDTAPKLRSMSKPAFEAFRARYGPMLLKGYKTTYLATLRKGELAVHLWKLEPAGATEDFEVRLSMRDGAVGALGIQ